MLVIWKDVTEDKKARATLEKAQLIFEEQKLANLLKAEQLQAALQLALKLERPLQVLKIIEGTIIYTKQKCFLISDIALTYKYVYLHAYVHAFAYMYLFKIIIKFFLTATLKKRHNEFAEIVKELKPIHKEALLRCAVTWNMNSRNSHAAQV